MRWRRLAAHRRGRLAPLILVALPAVAVVLFVPETGGAQTVTTYVSNIDQGSDGNYQTDQLRAQSFTTGSQAGGYTVTHVDIGSDDDEGDSFSAAIYTTNSSGHPVSEVAALTPPSSFAAGTLTFTAPANTTLAASTTYSVRIVNSSASDPARLDTTTSNDEDADAASGWSIGDNAHRKVSLTSGSWTERVASIRIAIKGSATAPAANNLATGAPTISGTAQVGQTLTAATSGIMDDDGLTTPGYTYQWIRVNGTEADISGATSSTYTLVAADQGKTIKVTVSFSDDDSNAETLTSTATATAAAADDCAGDWTSTCSVSPGTPVTGDIEAVGDKDSFRLSATSGVTYRIDAEGSQTSMGTLGDPSLELRDSSWVQITANDDGGAGFNARLTWTANSTGNVFVLIQASSAQSTAAKTGTYTLTVSANTPATGAPTISGTAQVGQTLTAATSASPTRTA